MSSGEVRDSARPKLPMRSLVILLGLFAAVLAVIAMLFVSNQAVSNPGPPDDLRIDAWQEAWSRVLNRHVDAGGRIDFAGLARDHADLDEVVKFVAAVDPISAPERFPTRNSRLAYYVDAYNAVAMHGVLAIGVPKKFGWLGRVRFFYFRNFMLGGRAISLYSLENGIIRPLGDPRVHFALNCMSVSCPRLPQTAFTVDGLDSELDAAAREFVRDDRNVHVDRDSRIARLSAIFRFYTDDFLAQSPGLLAYVNRYRAEEIPPDYKIQFMAYDWTVNDQTRQSWWRGE
ncbi:MAG TPA: DUF547 domain-containing protein [Candidatus Binataceae bacterium]|nr:DUF547 domain-containing protein [Candidatus Binataceae bacterium]